ncbi:hypothetical protein [Rubritalea marina]|uniref:hypothetical protein n=1 Tax=Rubritalea marina TaxID=361055 RepID=UPI00037F1D48|nr:hypothetical protein [Rubritalea marina]
MHPYLADYPAEQRDLTDNAQNLRILDIASDLLRAEGEAVEGLEARLCGDVEFVSQASPVFLEALSIAASKSKLLRNTQPFHATVVWAMYGETSRMQTREQNPHGEDALRVKVKQLEWLFTGLETPSSWSIVLCDDGCPEQPPSSAYARQIAADEGYGDRVHVITLQDAIDSAEAVNAYFGKMKTTDDSRKGGSILLAMWHALHRGGVGHEGSQKHIVLFTDGDLSANLAQLGKMAVPILDSTAACTAGQRYGMQGAILVKEQGVLTEPLSTGTKPDKLIILFRHFVRASLIPSLENILDTQAGFKAFDAELLKRVIPKIQSFKETFDVELLINTALVCGKEKIAAVPILFTEDFALTNFPSVDPGQGHLNMIRQLVEIYEQHVAEHTPAEVEMLQFIKDLELESYVRLIKGLEALDDGDENLFDRRWSLDALRGAIGEK